MHQTSLTYHFGTEVCISRQPQTQALSPTWGIVEFLIWVITCDLFTNMFDDQSGLMSVSEQQHTHPSHNPTKLITI